MRSFNFSLAFQSNMVPANGFDYWQIGTQHFWLLQSTFSDSTFNIQGFKNINIYKIEINGDINSDLLPVGFAALVQNWNLEFEVTGQNSPLIGNITASPNGFNMFQQSTNPKFILSKFQRSVEFASPIQSATKIIVTHMYADGIANESILSAQLEVYINFNVFYKFEGE